MSTGLIITLAALSIPVIAIITDHMESMKKMKLEAALRQQEMEKGYAPGTYSASFSAKKKDKDRAFAEGERKFRENGSAAERADLEKGIRDLEERIANIETIRKSRERN